MKAITTNRYNHRSPNALTPRQKQLIFRKFSLCFITLFAVVIIGVLISGSLFKAKAADNYHKYYTNIIVEPYDTLYEYAYIYGEQYDSIEDYIEEVCIVNSLEDESDIVAGTHLIIPYYSTEIK